MKIMEDAVPVVRAERFTIATKIGQYFFKIFQIHFKKSDGTIIIDFPYYKQCSGLLCKATLSDKVQYPSKIDFTEGGKVTSQLVKFSYHPDGNVHFSQDRKIFTQIRKRTVPLKGAYGHFFTVQINGPQDFKIHPRGSKETFRPAKRRHLVFELPDGFNDSLKFLGHYLHISEVAKNMVSVGKSAWYIFINESTGERYPGFIIGPPLDSPFPDKVLLIRLVMIPIMTADNSSCLTFVGGFDAHEIVTDPTKTTTFLGLLYPTEDFNVMKKRIGTVDFSQ
ncbi:MAG TPA: hypothetical protein DCR97_00100 [Deltaproteobacteria bacterium]|nr:hypothetical protein [Deltaproteobacteria bacterium]